MANTIILQDTTFIFPRNFAGDPAKDSYRSTQRKANLIIKNEQQAQQLRDMGVNVRVTKPREGHEDEYIPTYFAAVKANYNSKYPPEIYLCSKTPSGGKKAVKLDENTVGLIDECYVLKVDAILNLYKSDQAQYASLYIQKMYVEQDVADDPFAAEWGIGGDVEDPFADNYKEECPF